MKRGTISSFFLFTFAAASWGHRWLHAQVQARERAQHLKKNLFLLLLLLLLLLEEEQLLLGEAEQLLPSARQRQLLRLLPPLRGAQRHLHQQARQQTRGGTAPLS
jgi:hypothetical protein